MVTITLFKGLTRIFKKSPDKAGTAGSVSSGSGKIAKSSEQSPPGFDYDPLDTTVDSIRLLILHSRKESSEKVIKCTLMHSTFSQRPVYEALSYTWGKPVLTQHILVNGKKVPVRENLYWALHSLRLYEKGRVIWADAICIDQSNIDERSYQVGLMDYIYTRASCVLVWLGKPPDEYISPLQIRKRTRLTQDERLQQAVDLWIINRDYWGRLWIIQEIGLARSLKVCMGSVSDDWEHFTQDLSRQKLFLDRGSLINALDEKRKTRNQASSQLRELLEAFRYAQCTEPRDKIYGFLGLAPDCQSSDLMKPDYSKSLFQLYQDACLFFYSKQDNFSDPANAMEVAMRMVGFSQLVLGLLGYPSCPLEPPKLGVVYALGAMGGEIVHVGLTYDQLYASSSAYRNWKLEFERHGFSRAQVQELLESNEALDEYLRSGPKIDTIKVSAIHPEESWSSGGMCGGLWTNLQGDWVDQDPNLLSGPEKRPTPDISIPPAGSNEPKLFLSSGCLIGLAPPEVQEGDVICQFWNTDVVALLRKSPWRAEFNLYSVIGRVYLSTGYMEDMKPVYPHCKTPPEGAQNILIAMDMRTLSQLTA